MEEAQRAHPAQCRRCSIASVPARAGDTGDTRTPRGSRHASLTALEKHRFVPRESSPLHSLLPARDTGASSRATNHLFVNSGQPLPALSCSSRLPGTGRADLRARGRILWITGSQLR